jgi:NAD(P)-dependent dehydrogenase (short-subunit alcohol dehydrogenase family)
MRFKDKVALVTGAASDRGMGRAVALGFAREGASVALLDIDTAELEKAAEAVRALGSQAVAVPTDVSQREQVKNAVHIAVQKFGRIDIAVNVAGFCTFRTFLDIDDALWDRIMAVNVKGYFLVGQEVARHMVARGEGGKIVNVTSMSAEVSGGEKVHYAASKAATKSLTLGMAVELARYHINVNAVAPGMIDTNIIKDPGILKLVQYEREHSSVPWGRMGVADDIVGAVLFLASSEADYITGATILVDGGLCAGSMLPPHE